MPNGASVERRLAAILAADVVGYSRLMGADEIGTLRALKTIRRELADPAIARHHGRVVKTTGDGILIEFPSVVDAVTCAVSIQRGMVTRNAAIPEDKRIVFRIGINVGDIIIEEGDIHGDGVNIAARLEGMAEPGGICVSRKVRDEVRDRLDLALEDMGEQNLKNIARPVRVYRVKREENEAAANRFATLPAPLATLPLPDNPSIAVLPFQNMSSDPEQEYFADGMVEEIITGLSRIKWLFVIARNSSFVYKNRAADLRQVGRELGVRYVLEGSVRKSGNRVRITGQLIEAETGRHVWADRFDGSLEDIFGLQDEVTLSVVGAIEPNLRKAEIERVKRKRPDNLHAYDLVSRALPYTFTVNPEEASIAVPMLERALELEPGYARAHAPLAWCYHARFSFGTLEEEDRLRAIRHARAAIINGGDDASTLGIAGFIIWLDEHDHPTAINLFDRALELSRSNIFALAGSSVALGWMGKTELAIERAQRALRFSPFDPMNFLPNCGLAVSYFHMKRYEDALSAARRAMECNPRFGIPYAYAAAALVRLGHLRDGMDAAEQVLAIQPTFTIRGFLTTVGVVPDVFEPFAEAWREAGLPN